MTSQFLEDLRQCRLEFEDARAAAYEQAEEWCRGALLNALGERRGIDCYSLFMGNARRAYAYASEELVEYWRSHSRMTYTEFKSQWMQGAPSMQTRY